MPSLEDFVRDYGDAAYGFAHTLCGNSEEARELVQEAFYRILRGWDGYDAGQSLETWYCTVLRNLYFDSLKRYERRHGVSLDMCLREGEDSTLADFTPDRRDTDMLAGLERGEAKEEVARAMARLTPEHRAILTLCDIQGLGYEEMTKVLDCPLGTVRSRMNRARTALRRALVAGRAAQGGAHELL